MSLPRVIVYVSQFSFLEFHTRIKMKYTLPTSALASAFLEPKYFKARIIILDGRATTWNDQDQDNYKTHFHLWREGKGRTKVNINL
jgi:hypothetical protein